MKRAWAGLLIALNVLALFALLWLRRDPIDDPSAWVRDRVRAVDLTDSERRWESIGWVTDMGQALALSRKHGRPVFIVAGVGPLDGRCCMALLAMRGGPLSDARIIDTVNRRFIAFATENPTTRTWSWATAYDRSASGVPAHEVETEMNRLRATFVDLFVTPSMTLSSRAVDKTTPGFPPAVALLVRTLDGQLRTGPFSLAGDPAPVILRFLESEAVRGADGPAATTYDSQPGARPAPTDLVMRVVTRYDTPLTGNDLRRIDNYAHSAAYYPAQAFAAPGRDWIVLPRERWEGLLPPPDAAVNHMYTVNEHTARAIFLHLLTPDAPFARLNEGLVRRASLVADVLEKSAGGTRVGVDGEAMICDLGFASPTLSVSRARAEITVKGFIDIDATGEIRDMQLATVSAAVIPPEGLPISYQAVAYLKRSHSTQIDGVTAVRR